jgi:hypothetical protein
MSQTGGKRKVNKSLKAWVAFIKKVQREEKLSYKDAMKRAKQRKDKGEKWMTGGRDADADADADAELDFGGKQDGGRDADADVEEVEISEEQMGGRRRRRRTMRRSRSRRSRTRRSRTRRSRTARRH